MARIRHREPIHSTTLQARAWVRENTTDMVFMDCVGGMLVRTSSEGMAWYLREDQLRRGWYWQHMIMVSDGADG